MFQITTTLEAIDRSAVVVLGQVNEALSKSILLQLGQVGWSTKGNIAMDFEL